MADDTEYKPTQADVEQFRRIRQKLDTLRGPFVTNLPTSITIGAPPASRASVDFAPSVLPLFAVPTSTGGWSGYPSNLIVANPCDAAGSNVATNTIALHIFWPPTNQTKFCPYTATNHVIAYVPYGGAGSNGTGTNAANGLIVGMDPYPRFTNALQGIFMQGTGTSMTGLLGDFVRAH